MTCQSCSSEDTVVSVLDVSASSDFADAIAATADCADIAETADCAENDLFATFVYLPFPFIFTRPRVRFLFEAGLPYPVTCAKLYAFNAKLGLSLRKPTRSQ